MKSMKRIHKVIVKRMVDESPDTSWLGEYSNRATSNYSIDRAHSFDCISQPYNMPSGEGLRVLDSVNGYINNQYNALSENERFGDVGIALDDADTILADLASGNAECDCNESGSMQRHEYQYFNPSRNYVDKAGNRKPENTDEDVRKYVEQDYERMESLNRGDWCFLGIRAEADYSIGKDGDPYLMQEISSGGLWGIESDSDADYFTSVEQEELAELRKQLEGIGFSKRAISAAFKNVDRLEE